MRRKLQPERTLMRCVSHSIRFNIKEYNAIDHYCKKFRVKNKSRFMREVIISEILRKFDENYPTLWDDPQMKLF